MLRSLIALTVSATLALGQSSGLTITEPRTDHWWIAQSLNTLAWTGEANAPQQFSVFLANPDANVLTSKLALISIQPLYEYSKTINPGNLTPATGYTIELTDPLNSTNIYATSETFEIKAVNSPYPAQGSPTNTANATSIAATGTTSATASATSTGAASSSIDGALKHALPVMVAVGAAVMGAAMY